MKVKDLIVALQKADPEMLVLIESIGAPNGASYDLLQVSVVDTREVGTTDHLIAVALL